MVMRKKRSATGGSSSRELITPYFKDEVVRQMALFGDGVIIQIHGVQKADRLCSAAGFHLRGSFVCSCPGRDYAPA